MFYKISCLLLALEVARMSCMVLGGKEGHGESYVTPGHLAANDTYQTKQDPTIQTNMNDGYDDEAEISVDDENVHDDISKSDRNTIIPGNFVGGDINKNMTTPINNTVEICKKYVSRSYQVDSYYRLDNENLKHMKPTDGSIEMHISIKAFSDGYVILSPIPNPVERNDSVYEIGFGSGYNDNLNIRRSRLAQLVSYAYTPDILSATEFRSFYIKISKDGVIEVGKEGSKPFVRYLDPNPLNITYFGFSSWDEKEAVFLYDCPPGINLDHELQSHTKGNEIEPEATNYDEDYYEDVDNSEKDSTVNKTARNVTRQIVNEKNNIINTTDHEHIVNMTIIDLNIPYKDEDINKTVLSTTRYLQHTQNLASNKTKNSLDDENNKTIIAFTVQPQHDSLKNATTCNDTKDKLDEELNKTIAYTVQPPQVALENATTSNKTKRLVFEKVNKTVAFSVTPQHDTLDNVTTFNDTKDIVTEEIIKNVLSTTDYSQHTNKVNDRTSNEPKDSMNDENNKNIAVTVQPPQDALENATTSNNTKRLVFEKVNKTVAFSVTPQHETLDNVTTFNDTKDIVTEEIIKNVLSTTDYSQHTNKVNDRTSNEPKDSMNDENNKNIAVTVQLQHDALENATTSNNTKRLVFEKVNKTVAFSFTPQHDTLDNVTTFNDTKDIVTEEIIKNVLSTTDYSQHTNKVNDRTFNEPKDSMNDENNKNIAVTVQLQHDALDNATTSNDTKEIVSEEINKNVNCCIDNPNHHLSVKTLDLKKEKSCEGHENKDIINNDFGKQENEVTIKISGAGKNGVVLAHFDLAIYGNLANVPGYIDPYGRQYPHFGPYGPQSISPQQIMQVMMMIMNKY